MQSWAIDVLVRKLEKKNTQQKLMSYKYSISLSLHGRLQILKQYHNWGMHVLDEFSKPCEPMTSVKKLVALRFIMELLSWKKISIGRITDEI